MAGNATSGYNYGTCGILLGSNNGAGIYGTVTYDNANIPGKYAGYFDGKIRTTNDSPEKPTSGSWTGYSDSRLKTNISAFKDGISVIRQINPIKYKFNGIGNLPTQDFYYGVKAQDIQSIAPYCVSTGKLIVKQSEAGNFTVLENLPADSTGVPKCVVSALTYNYDALIYVLINSVKQLDSAITALKNTANPSSSQRTGNVTDTVLHKIELVNSDRIILYQNEPNPFDGSTAIRYFIPDNILGSVFIVFHDEYGKEIKRLAIAERGFGKIDAGTENLSVGIYSYSMVVNDKVVDTKKMIKNK